MSSLGPWNGPRHLLRHRSTYGGKGEKEHNTNTDTTTQDNTTEEGHNTTCKLIRLVLNISLQQSEALRIALRVSMVAENYSLSVQLVPTHP